MTQNRRRAKAASTVTPAAAGSLVDPHRLAQATDAELADVFRQVTTLPLESFPNEGGHRIDLPSRTIFNDEHFKGWLPKGLRLPLRDIFARLATGYAKRFWKQGNRYLGETRYLDGRILVKHSLEEFTLDRPQNDLDPGKYILLRYTDPIFEHVFYDVMKMADDGVIVYGGYSGRFPEGKRGFTGLLMRRYSFAELGERDHEQLVRKGKRPAKDSLTGVWRIDVVATSNLPTPIGHISFVQKTGGQVGSQCEPVEHPDVLVPTFVIEHFSTDDTAKLERELRRIDDQTMVGTWTPEITSLYAKFVTATPGLFRRDADKASKRYTMRYLLTREG
jgi:hypothetical protein